MFTKYWWHTYKHTYLQTFTFTCIIERQVILYIQEVIVSFSIMMICMMKNVFHDIDARHMSSWSDLFHIMICYCRWKIYTRQIFVTRQMFNIIKKLLHQNVSELKSPRYVSYLNFDLGLNLYQIIYNFILNYNIIMYFIII